MTKIIRTCERFDVVLVPFPFTDKHQVKKRPALVLSNAKKFNVKIGHSIFAMITSLRHKPWPLDHPISNLETAGLPKPSVVRMKLFTLDHRLVLGKIGELEEHDQKTIACLLQELLS